jgi:PAS domain S-box-containing protein
VTNETGAGRPDEWFRMLIEEVKDYVIVGLDPEGGVTSWNSGAELIVGYSAAEIVGTSFSVFYTAEDRAAELPAAGLLAARTDGRFASEGRWVRKDGTPFGASISLTALSDKDGHHCGFAMIGRDISLTQPLASEGATHPFVEQMTKPARATLLQRATARAFGDQISTPGPSSARPSKTASPIRILLAEDNPINQKVASYMLKGMGYRADTAGNGEEAVAALRLFPYDIVLMDVRMPLLDGLEATRRIRAEFPQDRQPIIIAMTAHVMMEDRRLCLDAGMNDYLPKPVRPDKLEEILSRWSDRDGARLVHR